MMETKPKDRVRGDTLEPVKKTEMVDYLKERERHDVDFIDEVVKSRRVAWNVAKGGMAFGAVALLLTAVVVFRYANPIPTKMLLWNPDTHQWVEASTMPAQTTYGVEQDKFWIGQFVTHMESYDFYAQQLHYDAISLMATKAVAEPYQLKFAGKKGLDKVLGDSIKTTVHVTNVVPDIEHGVATVRYTLVDRYKNRGLDEPPVYKIATVAYSYDNTTLTPVQRLINPFGFRVKSWSPELEAVGNTRN
ncbi:MULTISPECIES: type IV secretion system protein [Pseudomonas]|uniref:type IV secretion system protein n=1 Tax=Pseudomonas TaxID=286 RepID=UPI003FD215B7